MRFRLLAAAPLTALLVAGLPGAYGRGGSDPGITPDSILLGGTVPLTGDAVAYAAVARGADAYFKWVNARGGVRGQQIRYLYVDDAYNPAETARKRRQLVQDEDVFAIFSSVGTEHVLAVRPYLNTVGVPQLFVGSGHSALALGRKRFPWSMGYLPRFAGEEGVVRPLSRSHPSARQDRRPARGLGVRRGHVCRPPPWARAAVHAHQGRPDLRPVGHGSQLADRTH